MAGPVISLTTDFGSRDHYVAAMKGVMLAICPEAVLVDISHEVRPQAVRQASYLLAAAAPHFPPGTVHLVVVDPGVGTERRAVAVGSSRAVYVGPDNGVLSLALEQEPVAWAVDLTDPQYRLPEVSATFHGRDIFAPAAAHLACGTDPRQMGQLLDPANLKTAGSLHTYQRGGGPWEARVLHVDHFGNLITDLRVPDRRARLSVSIAGKQIDHLSRTFADVAVGELVAYIGSSALLEIALRQGSAAEALDVDLEGPVLVSEAG